MIGSFFIATGLGCVVTGLGFALTQGYVVYSDWVMLCCDWVMFLPVCVTFNTIQNAIEIRFLYCTFH